MSAAGRYELGEDGLWLDLSRPTNFDKDEELRTFATAEDYEVMEYMATLEAKLAERDREVEGLETRIARKQRKVDLLTAERGHANIRLVATILYLYCAKTREGWEERPGAIEAWARVCDEVSNLLGFDGVEGARRWLSEHDAEVRAAREFNLKSWQATLTPEEKPHGESNE